MALATPHIPTGEFVPERVWSCPVHDNPDEHYCDCDLCSWEQPECCTNAEWIDKLDADGNVVMRELTPWELMFQRFPLFAPLKPGLKYEWVEDEAMSRIESNGV